MKASIFVIMAPSLSVSTRDVDARRRLRWGEACGSTLVAGFVRSVPDFGHGGAA
jgi:hypothetical protein